jgi:hypothetical protein
MTTTTIDFSRSFLMFRIDVLKKPPRTVSHKPPFTLNNARIQIDCRCEIVERATGESREFVLGANCKTERVGVDRGIWTEPNADFVPILSRDQFLNLKTYDRIGREVRFYPPQQGVQPDRQWGDVAETFDRVDIGLCRSPAVTLDTAEQVIRAAFDGEPLVGRTEWEDARYRVVLEYPLKTLNVNERDNIYQTDTGPVLFPDLAREPHELVAGLELAFSAFNNPSWIEFIVRGPVEAAPGVYVYHYARTVRLDARNQVLRLQPAR